MENGNGPISTPTGSVMEVKLSQRNRPDRFHLLPKLFPELLLPFQTHSFHLKAWANTETLFRNQFRAIALRWKFQRQDVPKDQLLTNHDLVQVVEESETLNSISKQYAVSEHSIGLANKNVLDSNPIPEGHGIKIPSGNTQVITGRSQWQEKLMSSLTGLPDYKNLFTLASPRLSHAKTTGFVVLVPLIVFCIRCILSASSARISGTLKQESVNKSDGEHHGFRNGHWRSALRDLREVDDLDSESSVDSVSPSEDEHISIEDLSHAYKKLDHDYEKFLSECGLSKCGYWRGGS